MSAEQPKKKKKKLRLTKQGMPCPFDGCTSSDAYHEWDDGGSWCFSCKRGNLPGGMDGGEALSKATYSSYRGISAETAKRLGIISVKDGHGNVEIRIYKAPNGAYKIRRCATKSFTIIGDYPCILGDHLIDPGASNFITVVEGEEDWGAFYQMIPNGYCVSLSSGIGQKNRKEVYDKLNPFSKIVVASENDKVGKETRETLAAMFPGRVYSVILNKYKDANDYLTNGAERDFIQAWMNNSLYTPEFVVNSSDDFDAIIEDGETNKVLETPHAGLNETIGGIPLGHMTLITGPEGRGKTEFLRSLSAGMLKNHPEYCISISHLEESVRRSLLGFSSYHTGVNCVGDGNVTNEELKKHHREYVTDGNLFFMKMEDLDMSVREILDKMHYMVTVCGVKVFFIDPINQFEPPSEIDGVTRFLDKLAKALARFVVKHNVAVVITAHTNDEGNVRDSRMIAKMASVRLDLNRDHLNPDEEERNRTYGVCSKNRVTTITGNLPRPFKFDIDSYTIKEDG